jgi:hypothetical protein
MRESILGIVTLVAYTEVRRRSIAGTVTMKYRGFSRKSIRSLTRDITPAVSTFSW